MTTRRDSKSPCSMLLGVAATCLEDPRRVFRSTRKVYPGDNSVDLRRTRNEVPGLVSEEGYVKFQMCPRLVFRVACDKLPSNSCF